MQTLKAKLKRLWEVIKLHPRRVGWISLIFVLAFVVAGFLVMMNPAQAAEGWWSNMAYAGFVFAISLVCRTLADICFSWLVPFFVGYLIEFASYNDYLNIRAVEVGWVLVRDLGNIFLVVSLLVIAIATIIGIESYEWKKMLTKFVMAAVLVNFSRQICAFIIDAAQVVSMTFVNGVASVITGNIVAAFNLTSVWKMSPSVGDTTETLDLTKQLATNVMSLVFAIVLAVTLGVYCMIFLARMVTLWILITLSPLAFFLSVLPQTQKWASQWWSEFIQNVIMGPIIMFFFWLSLVTISGGSVGTEVALGNKYHADGSRQGQGQLSTDLYDVQNGLTDFMTWDRMASFIIGIGMLLAGVKVGTQIGGAGVGALNSISGAVKKTAMIATGASAALWAGRGALHLGEKAALGTGKFLGKQALQRSGLSTVGSRIQRRWHKGDLFGDTIGKKLGLGEHGVRRYGQQLKDISKMSENGSWNKVKKWAATRRMELNAPTIYLDKKDEKEKSRAEMAKTRNERMLSTTAATWGKSELKESEALKNIEKYGQEGIKPEKELGAETNIEAAENILADAHKEAKDRRMDELQNQHRKTDADGKNVWDKGWSKDRAETEADRAAIEDVEASDFSEEIKSLDIKSDDRDEIRDMLEQRTVTVDMALRRKKGTKGRATSEYGKRELEKEREINVAIAKDKELESKGDRPQFEFAVRAAHAKEIEDRVANLNFTERTERAKLNVQDMKEARDDRDQTELKKAGARNASTLIANFKNGTEMGVASLDKASVEVGFDEDIAANDAGARQRQLLSVLLGKKVTGKGAEAGAFKEFENLHGKETAQTYLRSLDEALKKTAGDYAPTFAGLLDDSNVDPKTGRAKYGLQTDDRQVASGREYWGGSVKAGNVLTLTGVVSTEAKRDDDGKLTGYRVTKYADKIDGTSTKNFQRIFGGMTLGTKIDSRLRDEWKTLEKAVKEKLLNSWTDEKIRGIVTKKLAGMGTGLDDMLDPADMA